MRRHDCGYTKQLIVMHSSSCPVSVIDNSEKPSVSSVADPRVVPEVHEHHPLEPVVGAPGCYLFSCGQKLLKFNADAELENFCLRRNMGQ